MSDPRDADGLAFTTSPGVPYDRVITTIDGAHNVGILIWLPGVGAYRFRGRGPLSYALTPKQPRSIADYCDANASLRK